MLRVRTSSWRFNFGWLLCLYCWFGYCNLEAQAQLPAGTIFGWGANSPSVPAGVTNVSTIAVGTLGGNLILKNDGTVVGWGYTGLPGGLSNIMAIASGQNWSAAVMSNGTLVASGTVPGDLTNVAAVSICSDYCLALKRDGTVASWGTGFDGTFYVTPQPPADLTNAVAISAGQAHGVALQRDGTVVAWGSNVYGQTNVPSSLTNVVALAAGQYHTVALNADGSLTVWGNAPVPPVESNVVAIASSAYSYIALTGDGAVSGWGVNANVPVGLAGVRVVSAGGANGGVVIETNDFCFASRQNISSTIFNGTTFFIQSAIADFPISTYQWQFNGTNIANANNRLLTLPNVPLSAAGNYSVTVSNLYGVFTSSNVALSVTTSPPFVTTQPVPQTVLPGTNTALAVGAGGSLPIYYQWQFNGTNIDGATNSLLSFASVQLTNRGYYDAVLSNAYGTVVSSNVFLHVLDSGDALNATNLAWSPGGDAPWFVENGSSYNFTHDGLAMQSGAITSGQQSIIQTTVTGPGTLTYWWNVSSWPVVNYLDFSMGGLEQARIWCTDTYFSYGWEARTNYLGLGSQLLTWAFVKNDSRGSASGGDSGWLDQVTFTPGGTAPFVTLNPTNQIVLVGTNASLNGVAQGTPPLSYQWQFNNVNIDGATSTDLGLTNAQFAVEGNYTLVISNAFGVTNTMAAFVNVVDFTESLNATNLVWSSSGNQAWFPETSITHDGVAAFQSGNISGSQQSTVSTTVSGPGTLGFWWKVSSETNNDYVNFTVDGVEQTRNSGLLNQWQQKVFYFTNGTHSLAWTYTKNATINSGSDAAWLDQVSYVPGGTAAFAASGPADQVVPLSSNVTFTVNALGTPPISYQWLFNGSAILSATNSSLLITNVQITNSGNYSVTLSNDYGNSTSSNAFLYLLNLYAWGAGKTNTVTSPNFGQSIVPTNLIGVKAMAGGGYHSMALLNSGRVVAWGYNFYGQTNNQNTLTNATAIAAGLFHSTALRSNGVVMVWGNSTYSQTTVPAAASNVTAIAAGWYHNLALRTNGTVVAWGAGTSQGSSPQFGQSIVPANLSGVIAIAAGGCHSLALRTNGTVVAWGWNAFGQTNVPSGLSNVVAIAAGGSNSVALRNDGKLVAWGANGYGQTNIPNGLSNVVAIACGEAHVLALKNDGTLVSWGLNGNGQTNVPANVTNVAAIGAGGYHSLALVNAGPITFLNPPYSRTIFKGGDAIFNPAVLGLAPMTFQWQKNGTNNLNATNATLVFNNAQLSDVGNYQLVASNVFGIVASAIATLTVIDTTNPTVTSISPDTYVRANSTVGFVVNAFGTPPLVYQWQFNGTNLLNKTNASLNLTAVQPTNSGTYSVIITNNYGSITTNVTLWVAQFALNTSSTNLFLSTDGFHLALDGILTTNPLVILGSTDLVNWLPLFTNAATTGSVQFLDVTATNLPIRFYRAQE